MTSGSASQSRTDVEETFAASEQFMPKTGTVPQLLVSVRSVEEATAAWAGGCDILDLKEPSNGSLGMANPSVIDEICHLPNNVTLTHVISAALGDASDDQQRLELPKRFADLSFVKMGCAQMAGQGDWQQRYLDTMHKIEESCGKGPAWIAVAYADWKAAAAPTPWEIVDMAAKFGLKGVLIDTCTKSGKRLGDWLSPEELRELASRVRQNQMLWAVAGSLSVNDLPTLTALQPDIIGIRTAACVGGERQGKIDPLAVRRFRAAMRAVWGAP